jgi:hypothetical protein
MRSWCWYLMILWQSSSIELKGLLLRGGLCVAIESWRRVCPRWLHITSRGLHLRRCSIYPRRYHLPRGESGWPLLFVLLLLMLEPSSSCCLLLLLLWRELLLRRRHHWGRSLIGGDRHPWRHLSRIKLLRSETSRHRKVWILLLILRSHRIPAWMMHGHYRKKPTSLQSLRIRTLLTQNSISGSYGLLPVVTGCHNLSSWYLLHLWLLFNILIFLICRGVRSSLSFRLVVILVFNLLDIYLIGRWLLVVYRVPLFFLPFFNISII